MLAATAGAGVAGAPAENFNSALWAEILQPSRTAPHQDSQHRRFLSQYFAQWKPAITRLPEPANPRRQTCGCGRTLLAQIARRNQLTVTGTDAAAFR
jgi:hypothetical protein